MFYPDRAVPLPTMQTARRGNAAEAAVLNALVGRGLEVLVPFGGGQPYDLVLHLGVDVFLRIQCKSARERGGCLQFNSRTTDHGRGRLPYTGLADLFGVYFAKTRSVFLVPVSEASNFVVSLRVTPTRNNQRRGVRLAADYAVDRWTIEALRDIAPAGRRAGEGDGLNTKSNGQALRLVTP